MAEKKKLPKIGRREFEVMDQAPIGICIFQKSSPNELIKYANLAFLNLFGYSIREILDLGVGKFIPPHPYIGKGPDRFRATKRTGENTEKEIWVEFVFKPILFEGNVAELIFMTDITAQVKTSELLDFFIKNASHAIKNAVNPLVLTSEDLITFFGEIKLDLENLLKEFKGDQEKINPLKTKLEQFSDELAETCDMSGVVRRLTIDLLDRSIVENSRLELKKDVVNVKEVISELLKKHEKAIKNKQIELESDISEDIIVHANETHINVVFENLITNAIKFNRQGGQISITARNINDKMTFSISDTGIGLSPEDIENVFALYSRINREIEGWGIGLHQTKQYLENYGGKIRAESEGREKGSKFVVEIPIN